MLYICQPGGMATCVRQWFSEFWDWRERLLRPRLRGRSRIPAGWRLGATIWTGKPSSLMSTTCGYFDSVNEQPASSYGFFGGWGLNKWLAVEGGLPRRWRIQRGRSKSRRRAQRIPESAEPFDDARLHSRLRKRQVIELPWWVSLWISNNVCAASGVYGLEGWIQLSEDLAITIGDPARRTRELRRDDDNGFAPLFGIGLADGARRRARAPRVTRCGRPAGGLPVDNIISGTLDESLDRGHFVQQSLEPVSLVWFLR